jgi:hypothetical protein
LLFVKMIGAYKMEGYVKLHRSIVESTVFQDAEVMSSFNLSDAENAILSEYD